MMHFKLLFIIYITSGLANACLGQTAAAVDVTPHWKKGETHAVKIKSTTTDSNDGIVKTHLSFFDAKFVILEATEHGYKVEWTYTGTKLDDNEPQVENQLIARLLNVKILIKLSDVGRFIELLNVDEVQKQGTEVMGKLIAGSISDPTMNAQYQTARQLISSRQGLEIVLLKQIKFYHFSFGFNYKLNFVQTNSIKLPNPLGGPAFDGIEKVELTRLDNKNSIGIIETSKVMDGKVLKNSVIEYVRKATNSNPKALEEMNKSNIELTESTMQQIDLLRGIIQKSFFKRIMNFGFQNRSTLLEMETVVTPGIQVGEKIL